MDIERQPLQKKEAKVIDQRAMLQHSHTLSSSVMSSRLLNLEVTKDEQASTHDEIRELFSLTAAYFVSSVSWVAMKATDTALLGHVGTKYLDASAYSDLYTSSTGVFIQGQILGVFCSQAFGAGNYELVGTWLKVSYVVLGLLGLPVMVAWWLTGPVLHALGVQDAGLRANAALYASILAVSIPAQIGFGQLSQFFASQQIMRPSYVRARVVPASAARLRPSIASLDPQVTAPFAVAVNIVAGVALVLGVPGTSFRGYGFVACPSVTTTVEYFQFIFVVVVFCLGKQLHLKCRPAVGYLSTADITAARVGAYFVMYIPAALAAASDYWRMSVVGAMAAQLSEYDLGVFNASYRIMWLCLVFALSLGSAIGNKLGVELGAGDAHGARRIVRIGLSIATASIVIISCLVAALPRQLGQIFTSDPILLGRFVDCRFSLATTVLFMNLAVVLERVPIACGRTNLVLVCGFIGSWFGQVPLVFVAITYWKRTLNAVYVGVAAGYAMLCGLYLTLVIRADFDAIAAQARARSEHA